MRGGRGGKVQPIDGGTASGVYWTCVKMHEWPSAFAAADYNQNRDPEAKKYGMKRIWNNRSSARGWGKAAAVFTMAMVLAVGDGLSSAAVQANAPDCCAAIRQGLQAQGLELGPVPFIQFCRVGAGDHIGDLTDCEVICLLVGERPGLVTNESMSAYLTYRPHTGIAESCRTVVSNIHRQGVSAVEAGAHIASLIGRILAQKASGIGLREDGA